MKLRGMIIFTMLLAVLLTACGGKEKGADGDGDGFVHNYMSHDVCGTEDVVYFCSNSKPYIFYIDKATGITGPLCGKPECKHNSKDCNAYADPDCGLSIYNDRIYWVERSGVKNIIFSCGLDGTDHRTEREMIEVLPKSMTNYYCFAGGGYLFYACVRKDVKDGKDIGNLYLLAIPLDPDGEETVILDEYAMPSKYADGYVTAKVFGDSLYIITDNPVDADSPDYVGNFGKYDFRIMRWDLKNHELETIYEEPESDYRYHTAIYVDETGIYFNQTLAGRFKDTGIYKYTFGAEEPEFLFSMGSNVFGNIGISGGIAAGSHIFSDSEDEKNGFYVIIRDFEGNVLVDEYYPIEGLLTNGDNLLYSNLTFSGADRTNAYFLGDINGNSERYCNVVAVALDGSGAKAYESVKIK